ncbi:MAG: DUF475 domain-containing protein [Mycobacteriales bacterium]
MLRIFGLSIFVTLAGLIGGLVLGGPSGLAVVGILIVLEVSLSFDNAVVNAKVLVRMSAFWQRMFLTVGIVIAVFGMRLVFPLVLVAVTASVGPLEVLDLAVKGGTGSGSYAERLNEAHPAIAGFGGMFLGILFLQWVFEDRDHQWLKWLERPAVRAGTLNQLDVIIGSIVLLLTAELFAHGPDKLTVLVAGLLGMVTYLTVNGLGTVFENRGGDRAGAGSIAGEKGKPGKAVTVAGMAGFFLFLYLEVLDASFSFDGVIGAFAITQDIFIIAIGLGVGAFWVRSLTVFLVRKGTLQNYVYLEHGAHWAIGALAVVLLISVKYEVPEVVAGLIGVVFIIAAFFSSLRHNRKHGAHDRLSSGEDTVQQATA